MLDAENPAENTDLAESAADTSPGETGASTEPAQGAPASDSATDAPTGETAPAKKAAAKRSPAKKTTAKKATTKKAAAKRTTKKAAAEAPEVTEGSSEPGAAAAEAAAPVEGQGDASAAGNVSAAPAAKKTTKKAAKKTTAKRTSKKAAAPEPTQGEGAAGEAPAPSSSGAAAGTEEPAPVVAEGAEAAEPAGAEGEAAEATRAAAPSATALLFQPPDPTKAVVTTRRRRSTKAAESAEASEQPTAGEEQKPAKKAAKKPAKKGAAQAKKQEAGEAPEDEAGRQAAAEATEEAATEATEKPRGEGEEDQGGERRRRRRGGRRRRRSGGGEDGEGAERPEDKNEAREESSDQDETEEGEEAAGSSRRRRRRRRSGESSDAAGDEPENTVTRVRKPRNAEDEITALTGSTRLEAKKQRRREGREAGRRRAPIVSEAEFLARRESVDRVMVIRQRKDLTQIAVLEDKVLVEHYVSRESQTSLIGNVYLGRVQNVLPSMEAAFIDIGKGRNAVLYAGEVNWDALGAKNGQPRKIEAVLKSGQPILVQVTKDPIGHKGARLTSQISLPGRFLVYVPDGTTSGISRKLPDTERNRLKTLLKDIVPESAGVIVRTAAEGASEDELTRDVERLTARWEDIEKKASGGNAPQLLYGEPDLTLKVVRDLFTEDFNKLVIAGDEAWDLVEGYVSHVAPDLADRLERYDGERDVFAEYRIDEQIEKALDRKVWLPSGGSLVIDRTEAMTVVDVNTGKFTGSGGNLEETVTKNNLEAAEEIVRQLRLRDIGGIIVVDFIDMVLESNRDLVLRRLVECLGRDRTRHQVAEVTSLGLVQMTRKRIGTGLLEAFSESCEHCQGRGLVLHHEPVEPKKKNGEEESRRGRRGRGRGGEAPAAQAGGGVPSPKDVAAMAKHESKPEEEAEEVVSGKGEAAPAAAEVATPEAAPVGEPAEAEAGETAEPKRAGRSRGGRSRGGRGRDGRETEAAESAAEPASGPADRSERPVAEQPPAEPPAAPAEQPAAETQVEVAAAAPTDEQPSEAPKGEGEAAAEVPPAEPAAPKIVTTVRRRGARRPAGPPSGVEVAGSGTTLLASSNGVPASAADSGSVAGPDGAGAGAEDVESPAGDGAGGDTSDDAPATPHVPVKKRGSRRR